MAHAGAVTSWEEEESGDEPTSRHKTNRSWSVRHASGPVFGPHGRAQAAISIHSVRLTVIGDLC